MEFINWAKKFIKIKCTYVHFTFLHLLDYSNPIQSQFSEEIFFASGRCKYHPINGWIINIQGLNQIQVAMLIFESSPNETDRPPRRNFTMVRSR